MGLKTWLGLKKPFEGPPQRVFIPDFSSDLERRYLTVNAHNGRPFALKLTQRGFYSEVNNLLNVMLYGLIKGRRLVVDESEFDGESWSSFFLSKLPTGPLEGVPPDWVLCGSASSKFWKIRGDIARRHRQNTPVILPSLHIAGGIRRAKRDLANMIFVPRTSPPPRPQPYAAVHVRRGDKIAHPAPEGEDISLEKYLSMICQKAPNIREVFVMTDDYTSVEEFRALAPDYTFDTLCDPQEKGYDQATFSAKTPAEKAASLDRLIYETQIAIRSDLFLGGFKSNVGRFITLIHDDPRRCFSMDSQTDWLPN